ncbi:MAG: phosphatidylserine decarboxylase [Nitrospirae bacterium]|nr:MAG: phosphatidylserine decarboxylase [Nitrospirota bacterium]
MALTLLRLLPLATASRLAGWLARRRLPPPLLRRLLAAYVRHYGVDLSEAEAGLEAYPTFEAFFTRRLRSGARPVAEAPLVSPCDGELSPPQRIEAGRAIPAKGRPYPLEALLGPVAPWGRHLEGGSWLTFYLSPRDYHRFHAPAALEVVASAHLPGRRWPVNRWGLARVPALFVENERVVLAAESEAGWPLVLVFVAALNVGRIHLHGIRPPAGGLGRHRWRLGRGEEMGYFGLGSTILLLLPPEAPPVLPQAPGRVRAGAAVAAPAAVAPAATPAARGGGSARPGGR